MRVYMYIQFYALKFEYVKFHLTSFIVFPYRDTVSASIYLIIIINFIIHLSDIMIIIIVIIVMVFVGIVLQL